MTQISGGPDEAHDRLGADTPHGPPCADVLRGQSVFHGPPMFHAELYILGVEATVGLRAAVSHDSIHRGKQRVDLTTPEARPMNEQQPDARYLPSHSQDEPLLHPHRQWPHGGPAPPAQSASREVIPPLNGAAESSITENRKAMSRPHSCSPRHSPRFSRAPPARCPRPWGTHPGSNQNRGINFLLDFLFALPFLA
jgi:hypothetical protein